jgi:hypothetical protein
MTYQCNACGNAWETPRGLAYHESHCEAIINAGAAVFRRHAEGPHRDKGRRKLRHELNGIWGNLSSRKRPRTTSDVDSGNANAESNAEFTSQTHVEGAIEGNSLVEGTAEGSMLQSGKGEAHKFDLTVRGPSAIPEEAND